jgi:pimeloyl-ACP methyl ester carboxylesterase
VVVVPGTQDWSPRGGRNPSDLTTDVLLMAQESSLLAAGVEQALTAAQRDAGRLGLADPVLLAGHSQGGIAAAALAADAGFRQRHRVTHVVASGAPIARIPVPPTVSVLALEHRQDAVPRLEGERNADRRGWLTVSRDLEPDPVARSAGAAHGSALYRNTAALADASGSGSLARWRLGSAGFLAGDAHGTPTVRDYRVERVGPAP